MASADSFIRMAAQPVMGPLRVALRAAALALLVLAAPARAAELIQAPLANDPMGVSVHRLANGLTVYLSPNPQEPRVFGSIIVRAGAKHDPDDSTGMAHYLEHMLFKGTERLGTLDYGKEKAHLDRIVALYEKLFAAREAPDRAAIHADIDAENVRAARYAVPNELDRLYGALGLSDVNAHTGVESTVFSSEFPANRVEAWATVEADRFAHPVFRLFQSELETVYEEKNRSLDNAEDALWEALESKLYKAHPYGQRTVLGSIEHLKNPSLAKMYAFFDAYYRPNNMAIGLSGDFDRGAMLALIERHFGALKAVPPPPARAWPLPPPRGPERVQVPFEAEERVDIAWLTAPANHPDEDALEAMDMVMDNAQAGIVNLRLNQAQRVKAAGSFPRFNNDAGDWTLWAAPKRGQTLEQAEALLLEAVRALRAGEFSEEDVRAVITDFEVAEKRKLESNEARSAMLAEAFASGEDWGHAAYRLQRLRGVTKADVVRVANTYLGEDRVVAFRRAGKAVPPSIRKPAFSAIDIDPTRESAFSREVLAIPAPPMEPRFLREGRDYVRVEEPWGRLYAARNPLNDLFSLTFVFDRGRKHERTLCEALRLLSLSGGGALSAEEFKRKLYGLGATMSVNCSEQEAAVSVTGLEARFEETLALARSRFEAPRTGTDTLKKMIEVELGERQDQKKSQGHVFYALGERAERGSRGSVLTQLTDRELRGLDERALQRLLRGFFAFKRDALYVGVRGPERLRELPDWGRAPYLDPPSREPVRYERPPRPFVLFVPRQQVQSDVGIFSSDEPYDPGLEVDYLFFNAYMGGGMSGVIFQEVREARALAYSSSGGYGPGERLNDDSLVWGALGTQADKAPEAAALLRELLRAPPGSPERFEQARKMVEEGFRTNVVFFRDIPATVHGWERRGLRGDPRPERFRRILAYRPADFEAFARRLKDKTFTVYVLGDPARTDAKALSRLGELRELRVGDLFPY